MITSAFIHLLISLLRPPKELLNLVEARNQENNGAGANRSYLLPMSDAQGSPVHPAYPSGHSINLGGFITTLKVLLSVESPVLSTAFPQECRNLTQICRCGRNIVGWNVLVKPHHLEIYLTSMCAYYSQCPHNT